jgi:hypothetical protein
MPENPCVGGSIPPLGTMKNKEIRLVSSMLPGGFLCSTIGVAQQVNTVIPAHLVHPCERSRKKA